MHYDTTYHAAFSDLPLKPTTHLPLQATMLFLAVLGVMVVMAMATMPTEEVATQATSVEMAALLLVTMATVVLEEMPLEVSLVSCCVLEYQQARHGHQVNLAVVSSVPIHAAMTCY